MAYPIKKSKPKKAYLEIEQMESQDPYQQSFFIEADQYNVEVESLTKNQFLVKIKDPQYMRELERKVIIGKDSLYKYLIEDMHPKDRPKLKKLIDELTPLPERE